MDERAYSVKTPVFEGPLDLLLDLVEKRKLFVGDVSLAQVTDDFVRYIDERETSGWRIPIGEAAEFILIASTLMLVKSRSLLPTLQLTDEEEASIDDLEKRLAEYKRIKELASGLKNIFGRNMIFEKMPSKNDVIVFSPDRKMTAANLLASLTTLIESLPKKELMPKAVIRKVISLEETIERLSERIAKGFAVKFTDFAGKDKISIIVGFLAMLELVKRGAVRVSQAENGGEIEIESDMLTTPAYA